jgi:hypothetical protein
MMSDLADYRIQIRRNGYQPLPINGKVPKIKKWSTSFFDRSEIEIRNWERRWPDHPSTGILTGPTPTLDIDILEATISEAADLWVCNWIAQNQPKAAILHRTGKAPKRAILFQTETPFSKIKVTLAIPGYTNENKLEFLGMGQQVVIDGIHPETKQPYTWRDRSPADTPANALPFIDEEGAKGLVKALTEYLVKAFKLPPVTLQDSGDRPIDNSPEAMLARVRAGVELHDNGRNWLWVIAKEGRYTREEALAIVLAAAQASERDSERLELFRDEMERAARTGWQQVEDGLLNDDFGFYNDNSTVIDLGKARAKANGATQPKTEPPPAAEPTPVSAKQPKYPSFYYGEMMPTAGVTWLVVGVIPEFGVGLISGQWGSFKTFLAIDLCKSVMRGGVFIDYEILRPGGVIYFAYENVQQIAMRITAAYEQSFPNPKEAPKTAPFRCFDGGPLLLEKKNPTQVIAELEAIILETQTYFQANFGVPVALIVIDTLMAAAGYRDKGDENDSALGQRLKSILEYVSKKYNLFCMVVDHRGKNPQTGTRGTSAKDAWADCIIGCLAENVEGEVRNKKIAIVKVKGGEQGRQIPIRTRKIEFETPEGRTESTLVMDWGSVADEEALMPADLRVWNTQRLKVLRTVLIAMSSQSAEIQPNEDDGPVQALGLNAVRDQFYREYPVAEDDPKKIQQTRRKAFNVALTDAKAKRLIGSVDQDGQQYVWIVRPKKAKPDADSSTANRENTV